MHIDLSGVFSARRVLALSLAAAFASVPALALDVTRPAAVEDLIGARDGADVELAWSAVTLDASGNPETIDHYNIYRGTTPDFIPDVVGGSNLVATSPTTSLTDLGAAGDANDYYYLVSAVDVTGNISNTRPPLVTAAPALSGTWTNSSIDIDWTDAQPSAEVVGYRVYYGKKNGEWEFVDDVGLTNSHSLTGLELFVNWYSVVTAVDTNGNESAFSNYHVDAVRGLVKLRAHDNEELCWGGSDCVPTDPEKIQRNGGFQILVPAEFPEGDWTKVEVTFTMASNLCIPPNQGTITKCGSGNPCPVPPCNGGYNPCGDPWDRVFQLFMVMDDCVETGGNCITPNNLELLHGATPFGTDALPPEGSGVVPPRALTLDVTPYAPLLTGTKYLGAEIVHFVQGSWWVTVDFSFSKRPEQASPKPPAAGIAIVGLGGTTMTPQNVSIPPGATQVVGRLFTTGHGNDEFTAHNGQIVVDGNPVWTNLIWRSDCSPNGVNNCLPGSCRDWNACGCPSCTFPRSGWCPGIISCHDNAPCDQDIDLTPFLGPGGTYEVGFQIQNVGGSWSNSLVVYWY